MGQANVKRWVDDIMLHLLDDDDPLGAGGLLLVSRTRPALVLPSILRGEYNGPQDEHRRGYASA